jgi:hypothetical protein
LSYTNYLVFSFVIIVLVGIVFGPINAQAAKDQARATVGSKTYKFDWDYIIAFGDENPQDLNIEKNSKAHQDTVSAKAGSVIVANVHTCCGDFGSLSVSIGDKVKVTSDGHVKVSNERHANQIGGCNGEDCVQNWKLPKIKKGSYNLVYFVSGETEVNELYITKIKIS